MKIKIIVPDKSNVKWRICFGNRANRRLTSLGTINLLAKRLPAILKVSKATVYVDYNGLDNETLISDDIRYLVYTTVLFLEDYLSQKTWNRLTRQWGHSANIEETFVPIPRHKNR